MLAPFDRRMWRVVALVASVLLVGGNIAWWIWRSHDHGIIDSVDSLPQPSAPSPAAPKIDWRNMDYEFDCAGLSKSPLNVRLRDGSGEVAGGDGVGPKQYVLGLETVASGDLTGDGRPETAVLLSCSPLPSNFSVQEVHVYTETGQLLAKLPVLEPLPTGNHLSPFVEAKEFAVSAGGRLTMGVRYYSDTDTHASGPSVRHVLTWLWDGQKFTTNLPYGPNCTPGSRSLTVGPMCIELVAGWHISTRRETLARARPCEPANRSVMCRNGFGVYAGEGYDGLLAGTLAESGRPFKKNDDGGWMIARADSVCYGSVLGFVNLPAASRLVTSGTQRLGTMNAEYRQWEVTCEDGTSQQVRAWIALSSKVIVLTDPLPEVVQNQLSHVIARAALG